MRQQQFSSSLGCGVLGALVSPTLSTCAVPSSDEVQNECKKPLVCAYKQYQWGNFGAIVRRDLDDFLPELLIE